MISLTDQQLQDFQQAVAWKTGLRLPDGRVLGVSGKRGKVTDGLDPRVRLVLERLQPAGKTVLEVGSCEGIHTVQLAAVCKQVVGLEVRPHNIVCALARAFVHDVHNARFLLHDVRHLDDRCGPLDIVFHVGVLYHLDDPVSHLMRVAALAPDLVLDTHYANDSLPWEPVELSWGERRYRGKKYREGGWADVFSGVEPTAVWLQREDLLRLLADAGFETTEVVDDRQERNGPRLTLLARRHAVPDAPSLTEAYVASLERQRHAAWDEAARARQEIATLRQREQALREKQDSQRRSWTRTLGRVTVKPLRLVRRLVARVSLRASG